MEILKPHYEIKFDSYIDAIGESSSRSRSVISYLMVATFISALALFNSLKPDYNWLTSRLKSLQNASLWVHYVGEVDPLSQETIKIESYSLKSDSVAFTTIHNDTSQKHKQKDNISSPKNEKDVRNSFTIADIHKIFGNEKQLDGADSIKNLPSYMRISFPRYTIKDDKTIDFSKIDSAQFASAVSYLSGNKVAVNRRELEWQITNINRAIIDNSILINVPILGISFDVNGLGIISAAAFSILYFLLFYNLARERKNFTLIFKLSEKYNVDRISLYQLLSMRLVLTIPGSIDEYIESKKLNQVIRETMPDKIKNIILKALTITPVILPVIIWIVIFLYDTIGSSDAGKSISDRLTEWNKNVSFFCGVVMIFLFLFCTYEWYSIGRIWEVQKNIIEKDSLSEISENLNEDILIDKIEYPDEKKSDKS